MAALLVVTLFRRKSTIAEDNLRDGTRSEAVQAVMLWVVFIAVAVILNGTVPFAMGVDMRDWTHSPIKSAIFHLVVYAGFFMIGPLVLTKGMKTVRHPGFLLPLLAATVGITLRGISWPIALLPTAFIAVFALAYLHLRFNLSTLGFRSKGWKGDLAAILLMGLLVGGSTFLQPPMRLSLAFGQALLAGLDRLFLNPASTVENLFYFGFLTQRLSSRLGKVLTPPLIGLMYVTHEMSNPEYWYSGLQFSSVFVGVTLWAAIYLWRRSVITIWLGDGFGRFVSRLFI